MSSSEKQDGFTCKLANKEASKVRKLDSTYQSQLQILASIKPTLKQIFKMQDIQLKNLTFAKMTGYSDNIFANMFEGIPLDHNFTQQELYYILQSI